MKRALILAISIAAGSCDCGSEPGGGDPGLTVAWQAAAQEVDENAGTVSVELVLSEPTDVDVLVPFDVGGSAVVPDDHDRVGGSVTVAAGEARAAVALTIVDDLIAESTETIELTLGAPSAGSLRPPVTHTIRILDNEAALTVVSPNGGEVWLAGDQETIRWTSQGGGSPVDLELSTDAGGTWSPIATGESDDGELLWTVPATASVSALVRVSSGAGDDTSNSAFEIRIPVNRWFVDAAATGGDGTTWGEAFATIQDGVAAAAAGDEIWVADGVYTRAGSDNAVLVAPANGTILGGFDGGESDRSERQPGTHVAVLDGESLVDHVVVGASGMLLDGFTITGGEADGAGAEANGAGMINRSVTSAMVRNCVFEDNHAAGSGGAVYGESSSGVVFEGTRFTTNAAGDGGGALAHEGCRVLVRDCVIDNNTGGAIEHRDGTSVIADTVIRDNDDTGAFAGGVVAGGSERMSLVDCVLARNVGYNGGAIYADGHELAVRRSLLVDNDAEVYGGAILAGGSSVEISSSTLVRNTTRGWPGVLDGWGGAFQIVNSIVWGNVAPEGAAFGRGGSGFSVSYSNVQPSGGDGDFLDAGHNTSASPNFVDPGADDFRLGQGSPCIDAGDTALAFTVDALGQVRVDDPGTPDTGSGVPPVDLGAFEFLGTTHLRLLAPNGGETWEVDGSAEITWMTDGTIAAVRVEVRCDDGGTTWREIVGSTAAAPGSFSWDPITGPAGARCRARISDAADGTVWDVTDGTFALASNRVWHVDAGIGTPGDGTTWAAALASLPAALAAAEYGDEVRVAGGAYGSVTMEEGVDLLGGWNATTGSRDIDANPTLLSGGGTRRVVMAADALIEGFLIEDGDASGSDGWDSYGGGMLVESVSPSVRRCTFRGNQAAMYGGAVFVTGRSAAPDFEDCRFESNSATNGGCVFVAYEASPRFVTTEFDGCTASLGYGGAIGSNDFGAPSLFDCTFTGNSASNGGALGFFNLPASVSVERCEFAGNGAEQNGGAIQLVSGTLTVSRSWFEGNDAFVRGGAIYLTEFGSPTHLELSASVVVRNQAQGTGATHGGGAVYLASESTATLTNVTSFENVAAGYGGAVYTGDDGMLTVINSILWADADSSTGGDGCSAELYVDAGTVAVSHSDVADPGAAWTGEGTIDADPMFVDTGASVDLHLTDGSPCIDVANGDWLPATDFDGREPYDHVTSDGNSGDPPYGDMGAFEYVP